MYDQGIKQRMQPSIQSLREALLSLLQRFEPMYIIIDALDECSEREDMVKLISQFGGRSARHSMMILSRREKDITGLQQILSHDILIPSAKVDNAIRLHVLTRLDEDARLKKWPKSIKNEIEDSLVNVTRGM